MFASKESFLFEQLNAKTIRKVCPEHGDLMVVEFEFKKGGVGEPHMHEKHEQVGYILEGTFRVLLGAQERILNAGDIYYVKKNVMHGVEALTDGKILDVFTPVRKDFLP